jgi:hypothetical protein
MIMIRGVMVRVKKEAGVRVVKVNLRVNAAVNLRVKIGLEIGVGFNELYF